MLFFKIFLSVLFSENSTILRRFNLSPSDATIGAARRFEILLRISNLIGPASFSFRERPESSSWSRHDRVPSLQPYRTEWNSNCRSSNGSRGEADQLCRSIPGHEMSRLHLAGILTQSHPRRRRVARASCAARARAIYRHCRWREWNIIIARIYLSKSQRERRDVLYN